MCHTRPFEPHLANLCTGSWQFLLSETCSSRKMWKEDGVCQPSMRPAVSGPYLLTFWTRLELRYWLTSHACHVQSRSPLVLQYLRSHTSIEATDMIVTQGPDALYVRHAEDLASEIRAAGGIITADDLKNAMPIVKDALSTQVRPPSCCLWKVWCSGRWR